MVGELDLASDGKDGRDRPNGSVDGCFVGVWRRSVMVRWRCNDGTSESIESRLASSGNPVVGSKSGNGSSYTTAAAEELLLSPYKLGWVNLVGLVA